MHLCSPSLCSSEHKISTGLLRFVIEFRIIMLYDIGSFIFKQLYFLFVNRLYQIETNVNFNCVTCIYTFVWFCTKTGWCESHPIQVLVVY
jgi:hypothetical protein